MCTSGVLITEMRYSLPMYLAKLASYVRNYISLKEVSKIVWGKFMKKVHSYLKRFLHVQLKVLIDDH